MATGRYAHWRTPTGSPYKGQDNKHAPHGILSEIGKRARIDAEGRVSWEGPWILQFEQVVLGSVVVIDKDGKELNRQDTGAILHTAIRSLIKRHTGQSPLQPSAVVRETDKEAAKHFRKKMGDYSLITSLSVKAFPTKRITIEGCQLTPLLKRDRYPYPDVLKREYTRTPDTFLTGRAKYQLVRVKTAGRSMYEATDRALEALAVLCGLWNLFATYGSWSFGSRSRKQKPIGVVHVGPIHTLHRPDRTPVDDVYWYEHDVNEPQKLFQPKKGWAPIEKGRRWAMGRMGTLPFAHDLRQLIVRYATALANTNPDNAFLQMWGILESLTYTVGAKYDKTVSRTTWIFRNREHAKEQLEYLRCYRNQYVHAARSDDDRDQIAQLVKMFIDPHLLSLLRNDFDVDSLEEYGSCLGLPTSIDQLRKRRQRLGRALRLRESWSDTE